MKHTSLNREQRQVRYLPIFLTAIVALAYVVLDLFGKMPQHVGVLLMNEAVTISRYIDLAFIYLGIRIVVLMAHKCQELHDEEPFGELWFVVFWVVALTFLIHAVFGWTFWMVATILTGMSLAYYKSQRVMTIQGILFFLTLTIALGFFGALTLLVFMMIITLLASAVKLLLHQPFNKLWRAIGLGPDDGYKASGDPDNMFGTSYDSSHFVDLSVPPRHIDGYEILSHISGPKNFHFSSIEYYLYYAPSQETVRVRGTTIIKDRMLKHAYNSNLLDWLLKYQEKIPEAFKQVRACFWGTVYEKNSVRYVRCLYFEKGQFKDCFVAVDRIFGEKEPALIMAHDDD